MHSSRMRTARSLTVSYHILCTPPSATMHAPPQPCMPPNHACPPATTYAPQQPCTPPSNHTPHNHACPLATMHTPPVNRMRDRCKNITLPQTSFAGGNKSQTLSLATLMKRPSYAQKTNIKGIQRISVVLFHFTVFDNLSQRNT